VGNSYKLQEFKAYCPKAFAAIGRLPATLADRSIPVPMQRRGPGESVARFRFERAKQEAGPIRKDIERTVKSFASEIKATYASLPELAFLSDRDEELFAPLFSVCAVLAPARVKELERCARELCDAKAGDAVDDSLSTRLLADIRSVLPEDAEAMFSEALIEALCALPESPWAHEELMTPRSLARLLRGFDVRPRNVRIGDSQQEKQAKGYVRDELVKAFERYLPPAERKPESEASHASQRA
jgi:hypothetical protein